MSTSEPPTPRPPSYQRVWEFVTSDQFWSFLWRMFVLVLIVLAVIFIGKTVYHSNPDPDLLKDGSFMRSTITILLTVSVVLLIVIVILALLFSPNDESIAKRVGLAREVLTPLLGILGTIIGFYFGSQTAEISAKKTAEQMERKAADTKKAGDQPQPKGEEAKGKEGAK
jgi:hypothetical protein